MAMTDPVCRSPWIKACSEQHRPKINPQVRKHTTQCMARQKKRGALLDNRLIKMEGRHATYRVTTDAQLALGEQAYGGEDSRDNGTGMTNPSAQPTRCYQRPLRRSDTTP